MQGLLLLRVGRRCQWNLQYPDSSITGCDGNHSCSLQCCWCEGRGLHCWCSNMQDAAAYTYVEVLDGARVWAVWIKLLLFLFKFFLFWLISSPFIVAVVDQDDVCLVRAVCLWNSRSWGLIAPPTASPDYPESSVVAIDDDAGSVWGGDGVDEGAMNAVRKLVTIEVSQRICDICTNVAYVTSDGACARRVSTLWAA